LTFKFFRWI